LSSLHFILTLKQELTKPTTEATKHSTVTSAYKIIYQPFNTHNQTQMHLLTHSLTHTPKVQPHPPSFSVVVDIGTGQDNAQTSHWWTCYKQVLVGERNISVEWSSLYAHTAPGSSIVVSNGI
jgi:hypothetical protein